MNHLFETLENRQLFSIPDLDLVSRPVHEPAGIAKTVLVGSVATKALQANEAAESQANRSLAAGISWGDGSTNSFAITYVTGKSGRTKLYARHTYAEPGVYPVELDFTNGPGTTGLQADFVQRLASALTTATVAATKFMAKPPTIHATVQTPFAASATVSHDQDSVVQVATARISWGDGSPSVVVNATNPTLFSWMVDSTHQYAKPGKYTIHFQVHFASPQAPTKPDFVQNVVEQVIVTR